MYQGKVGNYEGPGIRDILRKLDKFQPIMAEHGHMEALFEAFVAFKDVAQNVLGSELAPRCRESLHQLRDCLLHLHRTKGLPITPKFHVLMFHVEQVVDRMGRSLGKEGESSGEALHHHWKRLIEGQGEVNKKESDAYIAITLRQGCPN